ncbi:ATP-binding protein [Endothiovibrio diazotrophicus]
MMDTDDFDEKLRKLYTVADQQLRHKRVQMGIWLYVAFMPLFGILDWVVYPQHFTELILVRGIFIAIFFGFYAITLKGSPQIVNRLGLFAALTAALSISVMIALTEGANSPYYAGLNLIAVVMSLLLPWTIAETVVVTAGTLLLYGLGCLGHLWLVPSGSPVGDILINNVFFLVATSIICVVASHLQSVHRFNEFRLNYQLSQQNAELAELDRLKSQFFANVSHELRTPLTLILSPIQELLELRRNVPESIREPLRIAQSNAYRLLRLVNDLLEIIRLEEGADNLARGPVTLNRVVEEQAAGCAHIASGKGVRLEQTLHGDPLVVSGDVGALERIVVNLLNNAVKFTERGGWIRLTTGVREEEAGRFATIEVADSGIGIPEAELPHIFDRFRQVDGSSTRRFQGTGLGLSLVQSLTTLLGGWVEVESELGKGSTFRVVLPLMEESGLGPEAPTNSGAAGDELEALHRAAARHVVGSENWEESPTAAGDDERPDERPRLLVIEDDASMRRYLQRIMEKNFHVLTVADGESGIQAALEYRPALVLLDLMMPKMDGFEVTRRLRAEAVLDNTRIILMTAKEGKQVQVQALEEGADDFVPKPFMLPELRARVRNLVERHRLFDELETRNLQLSEALHNLHRTQAQLIHSEKLNALGTLSAGMLHEITNPLNFTTMALGVLKDDPTIMEDEDRREALADIEDGMGRIGDIVEDLGTFAHPSGEGVGATFPVEKAVRVAMRSTKKALEGIDVVTEIAGSHTARGAQSHIIQVLINLISNASKAIREANRGAEGMIRVRCEPVGEFLRFSVWDNGTGIPEERLSRVFDPFFTTRDVGEGMGMGLSVSHTIVENHGSELRVESVWGEWTRFSFELPIGE